MVLLIGYECLGKYLRANINTEEMGIKRVEGYKVWGEEEGKLFISLRSICQRSSLVPYVGRKRLGLKFFVTKLVLL